MVNKPIPKPPKASVFCTMAANKDEHTFTSKHTTFEEFSDKAGVLPVIRTQVAAGLAHTLVCTDDGEVWAFGGGR